MRLVLTCERLYPVALIAEGRQHKVCCPMAPIHDQGPSSSTRYLLPQSTFHTLPWPGLFGTPRFPALYARLKVGILHLLEKFLMSFMQCTPSHAVQPENISTIVAGPPGLSLCYMPAPAPALAPIFLLPPRQAVDE